MFDEVRKFIDAVIAPRSVAFVAVGPHASLLLIHGDGELANQVQRASTDASKAAEFGGAAAQLKTTTKNISIREIRLPSARWGWMITQLHEEVVSPVHDDILVAVTQIVVDYLKTQQLVRQSSETDRLLKFSTNVHSSLKVAEVAKQIANDARMLMNCERVSLYSIERGRVKLLAVSSVATIERRTDLIKSQQDLVRVANRLDHPIGSDRLPDEPPVRSVIERYQQKSGFPFLFGVGLNDGKRNAGYLLAESGEDLDRVEFARALSLVIPQATVALRNAKRHESVPAVFRAFSEASSMVRLSRAATILLAVMVVGLLLLFVKTDYKVRIEGELRPVIERVAFAPHDGVVDRVWVKHGEEVVPGQKLLEIRSPDLELAITKSIGESEKLAALLDAKSIALNQASSDPNVAAAIIGQLTSEISDIEFQLKTLADEKKFLELERQKLSVVSPIGGNVITWMVEELLMGKPVRWGDSLATIADEAGPWELRFQVPERRIGYIFNARQEGEGNEVEFFFDSQPADKYQTTISSIGNAAEPDAEIGPVTTVVCAAPSGDYVRRHGARLKGNVDCGRKSIGYVWTVELVDSLRRRFVW